ncbi:MAG TPA: hypothetical protein VMW64_06490 [Dehalococcoidia bacterium]|nr:hypothetical protein [Dehalococcoidia bacterium]
MGVYDRGSEWRRWDLHVHTPASYTREFKFIDDNEGRKYQRDIWEKYIEELKKISNVSVIGITDYFTIDGYKKVLEYRARGRLNDFDLILPNIEFRLHVITKKEKRVNIHLLFSDSLRVEDIEDFLARTKLVLSEPNVLSGQGVSCTRNGLMQVGRTYANDTNISDEEAYKIGCEQAVINLDQLLDELVNTPNLKGNYLVIGVEDSPGGLSEIPYKQSGHLRTEIYKKCQIIESSNEETIKFWLGRSNKITGEEIIQRFGHLKPCIHGSDAHCFERLCKPDQDRFCWIKADPSFDGLKQVIYEPEERVKIQKESPTEADRKLFIDSVTFNKSSKFPIPANTRLCLNKNLVAVIGGRGSGKSALVESIAFCFDKHAKEPINNKKRFIPHFLAEEAKFELQLSLGDRDGKLETSTCELAKGIESLSFPFEYLGQNKIEEYASDDYTIHNLISKTILESSEHYLDYQKCMSRIDEIKVDLAKINNEVRTVVNNLSLTDITKIKIEKKKREEEKRLLSSKGTRAIVERLDKARQAQTQSQLLKDRIAEMISEVEDFVREFHKSIDDIVKRANQIGLDIVVPTVDVKNVISSLKAAIKNKIFVEIEKEYKDASTIAKNKLRDSVDISVERIAFLTDEINRLTEVINGYEGTRKNLDDLRKKRIAVYGSLVDTYLELQGRYQEAIDGFAQKDFKKAILKDVTFTSVLHFKSEELITKLFALYVDKRKCKTIDNLRSILSFTSIKEYCDWLESNIENEYAFDVFLNSSKEDVVDLLFQSHFELITDIKLNVGGEEIPLALLSLGHKGTVILKLFLATTNCPIILDQPEDHIGNNFISSDLVPVLREAKKERQIIIVTHNANLVVNGDAEQVIVAKYRGGEIKYEPGSIENHNIRQEITEFLEGGREAFEKRERKYAFSQ